MVLERNSNYWNKGHPHLDRVELRPLPDAHSRFASLLSGAVDVIWDDAYDADSLAAAMKNQSTVYTYTGSGTQPFAFNTKLPPFDALRVRQALVMAIDRSKLLQAITNGMGKEQSVRGRILDQM